jgi:transcriptional regulator
MKILPKNQAEVLKLYSKGKSRNEICKTLRLGRSSVDYAIKKGLENINRSINILRFAAESDIFVKEKARHLCAMLENLKFSKCVQGYLEGDRK